jgi:hypothetical protein
VVINVEFLDHAFTLSRAGCPVQDCGKPFKSHAIRVDGAAAKVTFLCTKGHPTQWTSCNQLGRQALILNRLVPCAALMSGLKLLPTKRFLGLLQIDCQGTGYMKSSAVDLLVELTDQLYKEEIARVREEMHASPTHTFDLGRDCVLLVFVLLFSHRYVIS